MTLIKKLILLLRKNRPKTRQDKRERRKENIICTIMLVVAIIIGVFTWRSVNYAETFFALFLTLVGTDVVAYKRLEERFKSKRIQLFLLLLLFILLGNSALAKAELNDQKANENTKQEGTDNPEKDNPTDDPVEPVYEIFVWENDIYIMNVGRYCRETDDESKCIEKLISDYTQQYVTGQSVYVVRSDAELNRGDYGTCIKAANGYATDYANAKMKKVKKVALDEEIAERKKANEIYEKFNNLKPLGDAYMKKAEDTDLPDEQRQAYLEEAIRCYVKALALAYYDEDAENNYVSTIWDALSDAYIRLSSLNTVDAVHSERGKKLGNICKRGIVFVGKKQ